MLKRLQATGAAVATLAMLSGAMLSVPAAAAEFEWKFFTYFGANDLPTATHRAFAEDLGKATNGRLKVTVYAGGELPYKFSDVLRVVATNQVQMGDLAVGLNVGELPGLNVFDLPFLCTSFATFFEAAGKVSPTVETALHEKFGIGSLIHWTMPPQQIWLNQPIKKIDELKGRKIRNWSRLHVDMLQMFGASAATITAAEVTTALERRVVDGAITAAVPAYDWKFYEVAKYGYMLDFHMSHQIVAVNQAELRKLPADMQAAIRAKSAEWAPKYRKAIEDAEAAARKRLVEKGEILVTPTPEDNARARSLTKTIWENWAKQGGAVAQKLLADVSPICLK
ncbi:MAG: TRAP transporter substrate-binding protein DctP [Alphaproteobacteria bacterium]|nr:TRAP transporter substrate-binding protein DctP [Alphaproteobacteria bacterium]